MPSMPFETRAQCYLFLCLAHIYNRLSPGQVRVLKLWSEMYPDQFAQMQREVQLNKRSESAFNTRFEEHYRRLSVHYMAVCSFLGDLSSQNQLSFETQKAVKKQLDLCASSIEIPLKVVQTQNGGYILVLDESEK